jgi:hypothetical protein
MLRCDSQLSQAALAHGPATCLKDNNVQPCILMQKLVYTCQSHDRRGVLWSESHKRNDAGRKRNQLVDCRPP